MEIIKVSSTSVPNPEAGAIASLKREQDKLMIQTIGAAAQNLIKQLNQLQLQEDILYRQVKSLSVFLLFTDLLISMIKGLRP